MLGVLSKSKSTVTKALLSHLRQLSSRHGKRFLLPIFLSASLPDYAWGGPVAVIYPEIREPYKQVFLNIAEGVQEGHPDEVISYSVNDDTHSSELKSWLDTNEVGGIVALGRSGVARVDELFVEIPTVVGAVVINPGNTRHPGITQSPSPSLLFRSIKTLIPQISTIHTVYQPETSAWVIEQASRQAEELGLELRAEAVNSLREGAEAYRRVQHTMNSHTDALWLPVGAPSRDSAILQNILATAWKKDQVVFSSNLADVRRGVLFSMYPDNIAMGRDLGRLLQEQKNEEGPANEILFCTSLLSAINVRTAEHIGLDLNRRQLSEFNYVYPTP